MYSFNDYLLTKHNNAVLLRLENMCNALQDLLCMPVVIAGLHSGYKHAVSGVEMQIKNVTPRCILTYSNISMDKSACTSVQTVTKIQSVNSEGNFGESAIEYRRLPLNAAFNVAIVLDEPTLAVRMTEYLMMLSFIFPTCKGDEHTKSTMIFQESCSIDVDRDKNNYSIATSMQLNMQVIEPMTVSMTDEQYPLANAGVLMPDGTWNTTEFGQPILDDNGQPILDANGEPMIGNFVADGWYRLLCNYKIHSHARWDDCLASNNEPSTLSTGRQA